MGAKKKYKIIPTTIWKGNSKYNRSDTLSRIKKKLKKKKKQYLINKTPSMRYWKRNHENEGMEDEEPVKQKRKEKRRK